MRVVNISEYDHDTMKLGKPVYDGMKRILLTAGRQIHPKVLDRLKDMNISNLIVEDHVSRGITLEEMLDMPTWMDAIQVLQRAFEQVEKKQLVEVAPIQQMIGKLIIELESRPIIVLVPVTTIAKELQPYAHAINVTLLSLQIAKKLGFNQIQLRDLAIGAMFHDVGKLKTDSEEEHPTAGFQVMKNIREFNLVCAHVAFQHHELMDGSGYPRGISGKDFHQFAQICGLANFYENMTSNEGIPPHDVMERIMAKSDIQYDTNIISALVQGVPSYPPGTKVQLSTNEEAIVIRIDSHMQRPVVRTILNEEEISLEENNTMMISGLAKEK